MGRHVYTFENTCREEPGLKLLDGTTKIFLNSVGTVDDVSGDLKAFLSYVAGEESQNQFVQEIDMEVQKAKKNKEWRREYMTLLMRDQENIDKGFQIGREAGQHEKAVQIARGMLLKGLDVDTIIELTGLTSEEINTLQWTP